MGLIQSIYEGNSYLPHAQSAVGTPYNQWTGSPICQEGWSLVTDGAYSQCVPHGSNSEALMASRDIPGIAPTSGPSTLTGRLPALGWNTWNAYRCDISDNLILAAAKQFVSLGLKDAGYEYVNIDDCWSAQARNAITHKIDPDPAKFPNGIDGLANEIHKLGLKIGIYSDAGTNTCAGYPGSLGNETIDAATFADWGIDYLKYDNCYVPANWADSNDPPGGDWYNSNSAIRYRRMAGALAVQSRPIQLDLCIWGQAHVWEWGGRVGHSWRMYGDSSPTWAYITDIITFNVAHLSSIGFFAHNDMDMMEIGNGDLTTEEQRTHFAAWVFLKSPILLGTDLSKLSAIQLAIIKNTELLAFHQDSTFGGPAVPFSASPDAVATSPPEYYAGNSTKGTHVFIINTSNSTATKKFTFANVPGLKNGKYKLHDMWTGMAVPGTFSQTYSVDVAMHDTAAYLITAA